MWVRSHLRGLAGVWGWGEPGDLLVGVRGRPSLRARNENGENRGDDVGRVMRKRMKDEWEVSRG